MKLAIVPTGNKLLHYPLQTTQTRKNSSAMRGVRQALLLGRVRRPGIEFLNTNALVRGIVAELLSDGLSQVTLAEAMHLSPTWFSRWLNEKDDRVLPITAVDGLLVFLHQHLLGTQTAIQTIESALTQARTADPATRPKHKKG